MMMVSSNDANISLIVDDLYVFKGALNDAKKNLIFFAAGLLYSGTVIFDGVRPVGNV
uniref:Uncharacterized protein n=1 Tax=uncultured bacterium pAW1 TaxID=1781155 RepID=A0A1C9U4P3_9BACT|nr:hypothetical protein [uncultured bacterium pAW1]